LTYSYLVTTVIYTLAIYGISHHLRPWDYINLASLDYMINPGMSSIVRCLELYAVTTSLAVLSIRSSPSFNS
jgi:hypothetical protein